MIEPTFTKTNEVTYHVTNACVHCGHVTKADVESARVFQWRQGTMAAAAFSNLSLTQVEALFVSGICGFCWNNLFPSEDEDYAEPDFSLLQDEDPMGYNSDSYITYLNRD